MLILFVVIYARLSNPINRLQTEAARTGESLDNGRQLQASWDRSVMIRVPLLGPRKRLKGQSGSGNLTMKLARCIFRWAASTRSPGESRNRSSNWTVLCSWRPTPTRGTPAWALPTWPTAKRRKHSPPSKRRWTSIPYYWANYNAVGNAYFDVGNNKDALEAPSKSYRT